MIAPEPRRGFGSDNHATVHPRVWEMLREVDRGHVPSYGEDPWSRHAQTLFQREFGSEAKAFFVFTGTAANALSMRALLRQGEAILCSDVCHMHMDEAAAPEFFTGGKLRTLPQQHGLISLADLDQAWVRRGDIHFAQARCLSLTQPTELGTLYSLEDMRTLTTWARERGLFVHIDGARLGVAAAALGASLRELTSDLGVDLVSFGGTKNGLLGAEAIVALKPEAAAHVALARKQAGQLPSKSRYLAAQFIAYLEGGLWRELAQKEVALAKRLARGIENLTHVEITRPVQSNAVFVRLSKEHVKKLREERFFYVWDEKTWECRWMMSWDLDDSDVDSFVTRVKELSQ